MMGLFDSLKDLGKAAVGTAMIPIDVVRECTDFYSDDNLGDKVIRRTKKIKRNLSNAIDEIDE